MKQLNNLIRNTIEELLWKCAFSLACKFEIKATKRYSVRLENTERERTVHVEQVLANTTKLHVDFVVIVFINELEVLHTCFVNTSIEI